MNLYTKTIRGRDAGSGGSGGFRSESFEHSCLSISEHLFRAMPQVRFLLFFLAASLSSFQTHAESSVAPLCSTHDKCGAVVGVYTVNGQCTAGLSEVNKSVAQPPSPMYRDASTVLVAQTDVFGGKQTWAFAFGLLLLLFAAWRRVAFTVLIRRAKLMSLVFAACLGCLSASAQNPLWGIKDYTNLGYFANTNTYPWTWTNLATLTGGNYCAAASIQGGKGILFNQSTRVFHLVNTTTGALTAMTITNSGSIPRNLNYNVAAYDPITSRLYIAHENSSYGHIYSVNIAGNSVTFVSEKTLSGGFASDDWAFLNGKLYGIDGGTMEIWDVVADTYVRQNLASGPSAGEIQGAWVNTDGTIGFYGESNQIFKYNPATNTNALVGTSSTNFSNGGEPHDLANLYFGATVSPLTWGVNNPYTGAVVGAGGTTPFTYALTSGSLPTGLSLNTSTGAITGTPSVVGSFPVTFQVTDSNTPTALVTTTSVTFIIGTDTDGDGILDMTDIDDDNDGILDAVELSCNPNLLTNGNFELGNYTGWTITRGDVDVVGSGRGGGYAIDLEGCSGSTFRQTMTTQAGKTYRLSFWYSSNTPPESNTVTLFEGTAGATLATMTVTSNTQWNSTNFVEASLEFTATSTQTTLEFYQVGPNGDCGGVVIDDVSVTDVFCDADNDLISNQLDLDSDNDGCSDAYEGGATTDKTANFKFTGAVGANGLADVLETVVDNGTVNYSSTYSSFALNNAKIKCNLPSPGGVLTGLAWWYEGDAGVTTSGTAVTDWEDQSPSALNMTQVTASRRPTNAKYQNFNKVMSFDGSDALNNAAGYWKNSTNNTSYNVFAVAKHTNGTGSVNTLFCENTSAAPLILFNEYGGNMYTGTWGGYSSYTPFTAAISNVPILIGSRYNTVGNVKQLSWNGKAQTMTGYHNGANAGTFNGVNSNLTIGNYIDQGSYPYQGDIAEIIMYASDLTATQRQQVESYLAIKWGTSLDQTTPYNYLSSNGTVIWNATTNSGYKNNIIGIGKDVSAGLNQKQSQSVISGFQPILGIGTGIAVTNTANANAFSADMTFAMIGDNGLSSNYSVAYAPSTFVPAGGFFRMARIWTVQETGTVGTVTISVPAGVERLLVSNTNAFTPGGGTQEIAMTADGSGNVTAQVDLTNGQFFTFGRLSTGPGGVTAMAWWFEGDKGIATSGSAVTQWEDQSLNGLTVTQAAAGKQPTATSYQNFNPVVTFAGNKTLKNATGYWRNSTNNRQYNVFAVAKHKEGTGSVNTLFVENTNVAEQMLFYEYGSNMYMGTWGGYSSYTPFTAAANNVPLLVSSRYNVTGNVKQLSWNGKAQTMTGYHNGTTAGAFNGNNSALAIGNHTDQGSWPFEGDIAEMVMYPTDLTATQRQQVESYLALKWGTTLDQTTAYNYLNSAGATIWDATANSGYKNNIFGIGIDGAAALNQKQSKSVNSGVQPVFGLGSIAATNAANTAAFTADKSFMIAGADNGVAKFFTAITAPAGNEANNRFTRIWKVQETGTVGTVQFAIPSSISGGNTIYLIRSTDATFNASDTWIPLSTNVTINNMAHAAANVDFNNGDFFTVATYVGAPGCVAANLNFWLKADAIGEEDGASLAEWENQANTTLDSVGQNTVSQRPTYYETNEANLVNFNPSVSFDGGDELTQNARMFPATSAFTQIAMAVDRRTNPAELRAPMGGGFGNGNFIGLDFQSDGVSPNGWNPYSGVDGEWSNTTANYRLNSLGLGATNTSGNIVGLTTNNIAGGNDNVISYVNGAKDLTTITAQRDANFGNGMYVGSSGDAQWLGLVPEVIVYDKQLTDAEMQRVYSYLAIKYGATLNQNYVNSAGTTIYNVTGYANNIAGIGREICQTLHQKQSRSMLAGFQPTIGLTTIETTNTGNNAALTDGTFMIWGSDNGAAGFGTPITAPAGSTANNRFTRIWKVQETGTVGTVKFAIPQMSGGSTVYLIRSANTTFDATDTWIPLSNLTVGSTTYLAGDIDFANGDYFTIATFVTAPGCVAAGLRTWLKADAGITATNGGGIATWSDASVNAYNLAQPTAGYQPKFYDKTLNKLINFNPTADFDGADDHIRNLTPFMSSTAPYTFLGVNTDEATDQGYRAFFSAEQYVDYFILYRQGGAASSNGWAPYSHNSLANHGNLGKGTKYSISGGSNGYWNGANFTSDAKTTIAQPSISGVSGDNVLNTATSRANFFGWTDGYKSNPGDWAYTDETNSTFQSYFFKAFAIGADMGADGNAYEFWKGRVPEIFVYDRQLTDAEMARVNTYLAIKYGITLGQGNGHVGINGNNYNYLSGAGTVIWDATANATYKGNIAGIGRDNCQGLNQKQSTSIQSGFQPIIGLGRIDSTNAANTATLADASFMLWGNDAGAASFGTAITAPAGTTANNRFTRIWKVQETGTVGTVKVAIPQVGSGSVYLVRSTDVTFDAADTWVPLSSFTLGGTDYMAGEIDFANGDFFTIATYLTGPGGVVDVDFWVKSDDAGTIATSWKDHSKNGNAIEAVGAWSLTPADAAHNYHPSVGGFTSSKYFKDESSSLTLDNTYGNQTRTPYTIFSAVKPTSGVTGRIIGIDNDELFAAEPGFSIQNLKPYFYEYFEVAGSDVHTQAIMSGQTSVLSFNAQQLAANSCNMRMGKDGAYENFARTGYFHNLGENLVLGYGTWDINAAFPGDIMEVAWYKRDLSTNEQDRVNSYLGIKNGVTLAINYLASNGSTFWNRTTNSGYNNNIFGIGRDDASALHQKQARSVSSAMLTFGIDNEVAASNIANTGGVDNNFTFLMAGDNGLTGTVALTVGGACAPPPSSDKRTVRIWKTVETGSVESTKVQFDMTGLGFNAAFPVYMMVSADNTFSTYTSIPMSNGGVGNVYTTNYDFTGTQFIAFSGNTTPLTNVCEGNKTMNWLTYAPFDWWSWTTKTKNYTVGDQQFQVSVTDPSNTVYINQWYPVSNGNTLYIPRYDGSATQAGKITTKIALKDAAGVASKPAMGADFTIYGVDGHWGKDVLNVYGKLNGAIVNPKLSRNRYTWVTLNSPTEAKGSPYYAGGSAWGQVYVDFDSPIDEIYVELNRDNAYAFKSWNDLAIGAINITCSQPVPEVVTPDNVYVYKEVIPKSSVTNEPFKYKFTIQNLNCGDKTVNLNDVLPTGLTWVDSTLASPLVLGTVNSYGGSNTLTLGNITVPAGTSYIYANAVATVAGTFNNQATFTVNGNTYQSDEPSLIGGPNPTPVTITAITTANIAVTKAVNKTTAVQNEVVRYTFTLTNSESTAITTVFEDALNGGQGSFVASSLAGVPGAAIVSTYAGESALTIRNLTIPANGSLTFTIDANTGTTVTGDTIRNSARLTQEANGSYRQVTKTSNTVRTIIGCQTISAPTITITQPSCASATGTVTVTAPASGVTYSFNNGVSYQASATSSALATGTHYVKTKLISSGCVSDSATAVLNAQPVAPSVTTAPVAVATCAGNNAQFTVVATGTGLTYQWQQNTGAGFANIVGQTSATLTLSSVTVGMNAYTYQVIVSGTCTPSVTTTPVALTVNGAPSFTTQPANTAACIGTTATFTAAATGVGTTYQWERSTNGGTSYSVLSGQTNATYTTSAVTAAMNNYKYRVIASQAGCGTTTSNVVTLSTEGVITISAAPSAQSTCAGGNATFSTIAAVSTGGTLAYQWEESTNAGGTYTPIAGQTSASLTLSAVTGVMSGNLYRVKVTTGACGTGVTSTGVALTVEGPVTFTTPPASQTLCVGSPVSFTVVATVANGTPQYQWQIQTVAGGTWANLVGENAATLALGNATVAMTGYSYRVNVSSTGCASASSTPATLTVEGPVAITTQPLSTTICAGSNASFTVATTTGAGTAAYQWDENTGGGWIAMAGETNATLNLTAVANTKNGYQYRVRVTTGACATPVVSSTATLTVHGAISITTQPTSVVVLCSGSSATFSVVASNGVAGTLLYQWQVNNGGTWANIGGANSASYNIPSVNLAQNGYQYRAQITTSACTTPVNSNPATLTVNGGVAITAHPVNQTVCDGSDVTFSVTATALGALTYQWQENTGSGFVNIAGETAATLTLIAVDNSTTGYQYRVVVTGGGCAATNSNAATLTVEGPVTVTTQPLNVATCVGSSARFVIKAASPNGTVLYQWYVSTNGGASYSPIASATDSFYLIAATTVAMNGNRYRVGYRTGACPEQLSNFANLSVEGPFTIATQPVSQTVCAGTNATFSISASVNVGTLTQQWQVKTVGGAWTNITGQLLSSLNLGNATAAMNGNKYRVALSTPSCGIRYSDSVTLNVDGPIVFSQQPASTSVCGGQPVNFVSKASNSGSGGAISYQWQESPDNIAWANLNNAGVYSGVTTDSLSISNTTGLNGKYYRLRAVAGVCTSVNSASAALTTTGAAPTSFAGTDATMCAVPGTGFTLSTATSTNGTISWTSTGTGTFSNLNLINPIYTPSAADLAAGRVTLILVTTGTAACSALTAQDNMDLTFDIANVPTANAGPDLTICTNGLPINFASLAALPTSTNGSPSWSKLVNVTGTFNNINTLLPVFTPSAADLTRGNVTLTLTTLGTAGVCNGVQRSDAVVISFTNNNVTASTLTGGASIISGASTNLNVAITGGTAPYTVVYSNGTSNTTVTNYTSGANIPVAPSVTTTYTLVSVSDAISCPSTAVTGSAVVTVNTAPDLVTIIGQPLTPLTVGTASNVPVTVKNIGGSPAPGIITTVITLPAGTSAPATFTTNGSTCNTAGLTVTCTNPGPIPAGDSIKILVPVTPDTTTIGTKPVFNAVTNPVVGETSTGNNTSTPTAPSNNVLGVPDLVTTVGQPLTPLTVGSVSDIPVTVRNVGNGAAPGVISTMVTLPAGVSAPATFTQNGWTCSTALQTVTCTNPGPIDAGRDSTFKVPVTPSAATVNQPLSFTAETTPVVGETNTGNNVSIPTSTPAVLGVPDLVTTVGQPLPQLTAGQQSSLPITVANIGSGDALGIITTTITLPAGVSAPANFTTNGWTCATSGQAISCTNPGPIVAGTSSVINAPVTPNASIVGTRPVFNATTTPVSGETNLGNNIALPTTTTSNVAPATTVQLAAKVFLAGAYIQATGMMHDSLRVKGLIPSTQPYGAAPYNTVASGLNYAGTESVAPSVLAVTGANAIVDWVLVELRSAPNTTVVRRAALIQRDGDIVDVDGTSPLSFTAPAGSYHVVIRHRNHLGVMTANAIALSIAPTTVDFTNAATTLYQRTDAFANANGMRTMGSVQALWAGNANVNQTVIASGAGSDGSTALTKVLLDVANTTTSASFIVYNKYQAEDLNMDGRTIYQGSGSDVSTTLLNVLNHPSNAAVTGVYVIYQQLP